MKQPGSTMLIIGVGSPKGEHKENNMTAEFKSPEGFSAPEGTKDGDTFDAMVTLRKEGDSLYVEAIEGISVTEGETETPEKSSEMENGESEDSQMGFLDAVESKMSKSK